MDLYTVAFIGDSGVGKTSIITRHMFSKFTNDYNSTIEDFYSTIVKLNHTEVKPSSFDYPVSL
jgi:GTPase SAR1 family protein